MRMPVMSKLRLDGEGARLVKRRDVLAGTGALGAMAVLGALSKPITAFADTSSGLGAFFITITSSSNSQPMVQAVLTLAGGGVAAAVSAAPRGTHLGSWNTDSRGGLQFRLIAFQFDSSGNNTGYLQVVASGQQHVDAINATYTVTFVPVAGSSQVVDNGSLAGNRLPA